jgi:hypothetical protein
MKSISCCILIYLVKELKVSTFWSLSLIQEINQITKFVAFMRINQISVNKLVHWRSIATVDYFCIKNKNVNSQQRYFRSETF